MTISTNRNKKQTSKNPPKYIIRSYPIISSKVDLVLTGRAGAENKMMLVMFAQERSKQTGFWSSNILLLSNLKMIEKQHTSICGDLLKYSEVLWFFAILRTGLIP